MWLEAQVPWECIFGSSKGTLPVIQDVYLAELVPAYPPAAAIACAICAACICLNASLQAPRLLIAYAQARAALHAWSR